MLNVRTKGEAQQSGDAERHETEQVDPLHHLHREVPCDTVNAGQMSREPLIL